MSTQKIKQYQVNKQGAGERLDKYLDKKMKNLSRSQIKKLILLGSIKAGGKKVPPHYFIKADEIIEVYLPISPGGEKKRLSPKAPLPNFVPEIISEDENFIIINKPVGLLVHPTGKREPGTLADWLCQRYPGIEKVGEEKYREGIIHRLDRDVSGIMVAAKTNKAYDHLKQQFKERAVAKEYVALVYGRMEKSSGEIDLPIGRSRDGKFVAHPRVGKEKLDNTDRHAKTLYWVTELIRDFSLLKIKIVTGRTHQIRAHLSAIGHPILGDQLYKPKKSIFKQFSKRIKVINPGRIFLHSRRIGFYNLDGQLMEFESPVPAALNDFLKKIKDKIHG